MPVKAEAGRELLRDSNLLAAKLDALLRLLTSTWAALVAAAQTSSSGRCARPPYSHWKMGICEMAAGPGFEARRALLYAGRTGSQQSKLIHGAVFRRLVCTPPYEA